MHQHYQNKLTLKQEQKSYNRKLNRRQKSLRQHTASADIEVTIFWYKFMKLSYFL